MDDRNADKKKKLYCIVFYFIHLKGLEIDDYLTCVLQCWLFSPKIVSCLCPVGSNPIRNQNTLISLTVGGTKQTSDWIIRVVETTNTETKLGITPAADCIVGLYSTYVTVITSLEKQRSQRNQATDFYVLFNAWAPCKHNCLSS